MLKVMSLLEVEAPAKARPFVPSAIQGLLATDQPEGREAGLEVGSLLRVEAAVSGTTRVKALGPPQMEEL